MPVRELANFKVSHLQVLDAEGKADPALDPKLSEEQSVSLYRAMFMAREADQRMLKLQRQGRLGTFPLCTGQEAASCGAAFAMQPDDWFVCSYREIGARLLRGDSLLNVLRYWNGYEEATIPEQDPPRMLPVTVVIASQLLHAVGIAYAAKYRGENKAVLACIGDGGTSEGEFHEALNFAAVWKVPVVFLVQNNRWAISVPVAKQMASQSVAQKSIAYGMEGVQVDGNDPLAVYLATDAALERARAGEGPSLIEAMTYRLMMHTTADDPKRYRSDDESKSWWEKDPLPRFKKHLVHRKFWDDAKQTALETEIKATIDSTVKEYEREMTVKWDAPFDHLYATSHPYLEEQRADFLAHLKRKEADRG
jgi:pyruvate dehydrogenase E1 component alpha subunit